MTSRLRLILFKTEPAEGETKREYTLQDFDDTFVIPKKLLTFVTLRMTHNISEFRADEKKKKIHLSLPEGFLVGINGIGLSIAISSIPGFILSGIWTKCWNMFFWFEVLNILVGMPLEFVSMLVTAVSSRGFNDSIKVFRTMPCFGSSVLSMIKSLKLHRNRRVFEELFHELRELWPQGELSKAEHAIICASLKQLNFIIKGYHWCNNVLLVSFLTPPVVIKLSQYFGYDAPMLLTFDYWLPFNPFQPYIHETILFLQTWGAVVVIYFNVLWDMLFCTFLGHITIQFDLLARRVRRLIYVPIDRQLDHSYPLAEISREFLQDEKHVLNSYTERDWELRHQKELIAIVKRHHTLIRLAGTVESMFSFALLVNFIYSSVIICFCGFCSVLLEKWNELAYKTYLVTALAQTWLMCWYGQQLLDSSCGVGTALFESGWYVGSSRIKSAVLIMLQRSQNGIRVTTYGFSVISLQSFSTIIKTSWSYFTLLLNFYMR